MRFIEMDYKFFISHPVKILFFLSLYRRIFFLPICMKEEEGFICQKKRCYTVKEIQEILDVSRPTVYAILKKKEFRWIQLDGGKYRISKKSFGDWLDKQPE